MGSVLLGWAAPLRPRLRAGLFWGALAPKSLRDQCFRG
ncbi:hypothetical protein L838_0991 [Mycobacterium avium MAV_120709_2344]|nr:hypothetical protein L838_0991 [Mycobacterium avium MAV_120709_2344]